MPTVAYKDAITAGIYDRRNRVQPSFLRSNNPQGPNVRFGPAADLCAAKKLVRAVLVQADALLINHIAPGKRTLVPSA